jgi:HPt (histidine-containing phosphotransfer) domain-containing protein
MRTLDSTLILDQQQLRDVTFDDSELMREVITALIEDTSAQFALLDAAIRDQSTDRCKRLAHYCKGACVNVGANAAAEVLRRMEQQAGASDFEQCSASLASLGMELDRLRVAADAL